MSTGMTERYVRARAPNGGPAFWARRVAEGLAVLTAAPWSAASRATGEVRATEGLTWLAPAEPSKIVALAYNYRDLFADPAARARADESHFDAPGFEPLVFLKGPNCLADPSAPLVRPAGVTEMWIEVELAAVIGRRAKGLRDAAAARDVVFGVTVGNDVSALNVLGRDWHLARSKALDGFCPLGPELVRGIADENLAVRTSINGRVTQASTTAGRILDTFASVALVSQLMTLEPGDVVLTGTPAGARQSVVQVGDQIVLSIEELGELRTTVIEEPSAS